MLLHGLLSKICDRALANGGAIYVGEATAQRLDDAFALCALEPQAFKNVREPVVVYEVLGQQTLVEAMFLSQAEA